MWGIVVQCGICTRVSWTFSGTPVADDLGWDTAVGFSAEELFVLANMGNEVTIARIRLDSLGPGEPPD
jgi:hypothetical protein